ncbi:low molecular weight protein-tyrosine-phosphatase [Aurantiacibacter spongiae]|uniref:protein-tyrosine-phosphatase n=1 Tax=Aurantiacibacter spongiae TaxID=2488860 RepID=A0A3N5DH32_9SPHN|nr:low molecular weight protein-tyrosine-phosphatase [Aurantiacibacter spongiae]RPF70982.1 low molecular weight phosphotyrosine protein phosphatase [Aurantiacibacter spongiae]
MAEAGKPSVLFVCLGNICRSPLAEGAFREAARTRGLDIEIDSAGTGEWHVGDPPDDRAIAQGHKVGIDISGLRARQVEEADFTRFTHIYALDAQNLANLRQLAPDNSTAEIALLLDAVPGWEGKPVFDPYEGGASVFEKTWHIVKTAADALADRFAA